MLARNRFPRLVVPVAALTALAAGAFAAGALAAQQPAAAAGATAPTSYQPSTHGTRWLEGPGVAIKVLVEASNFGGGEVEVAEITLEQSSVQHRHTSSEIIYVLEGVLDHVVNGTTYRLEPGMVGVVKTGDQVVHKVASTTPVKAVLVWAPGGEADRLAKLFKTRPVEATAERPVEAPAASNGSTP